MPINLNRVIPLGSNFRGNDSIIRNENINRFESKNWLVMPIVAQSWLGDHCAWFWGGVVGIVLLAGVIIYFRIKCRKKLSLIIEQQVLVRTLELNAAIEELGQSELTLLKSNQMKDKLMTMVLHDLRSPIRFVTTLSDNLLENHLSFDEDTMSLKLSELSRGVGGIKDFTEDFFLWVRLQHEEFGFNSSCFPIQRLFDELAGLYENITSLNGSRLCIGQSTVHCNTDYQILAFILRNLIDNANKYTIGGTITINCEVVEDLVVIRVSDTGQGMTEAQIEAFLDPAAGVSMQRTGSFLVMEMLRHIHGSLIIESNVGMGSRFLVNIPYNKVDSL
ncbi:sensor histidine kinase KdpD [Dyadobacter sp. CY312]|uniref:sensor histidine kinase n=1 Tax=Dyadobacter sp. CY312 TaxID=2907303 RepID=UPI001F2ED3EF|nr:HAMP domain-containing sensor histidine kinase [Dyadobacter sp. CY312]MCE7044579.1 HAMP domain-containing histidine kinase [Dyadobacter sp. CY312]